MDRARLFGGNHGSILLLGKGNGQWEYLKPALLYCSGLHLESPSKTHVLNVCSQHAALLEDGTFDVDLVGGSQEQVWEEGISTPALLSRQASAIPPRHGALRRGTWLSDSRQAPLNCKPNELFLLEAKLQVQSSHLIYITMSSKFLSLVVNFQN